jgi:hypothetical protein
MTLRELGGVRDKQCQDTGGHRPEDKNLSLRKKTG